MAVFRTHDLCLQSRALYPLDHGAQPRITYVWPKILLIELDPTPYECLKRFDLEVEPKSLTQFWKWVMQVILDWIGYNYYAALTSTHFLAQFNVKTANNT
jgi:hypothetical protein